MSLVIAAPGVVAMAAESLAGIDLSTAANAAAAVPTRALVAAAGDEVSVAVAALFSHHAEQYQARSVQAGGVSAPGSRRRWPQLGRVCGRRGG
ncbi:PE family protein [Mycobacterium simiae]|uniref:PE family protein n=1 Tax=Mycobacterium simiae TaxID=1784 RepID=UPI0021CD9272|nr:PE family protein [Mycobacterium simiae]